VLLNAPSTEKGFVCENAKKIIDTHLGFPFCLPAADQCTTSCLRSRSFCIRFKPKRQECPVGLPPGPNDLPHFEAISRISPRQLFSNVQIGLAWPPFIGHGYAGFPERGQSSIVDLHYPKLRDMAPERVCCGVVQLAAGVCRCELLCHLLGG
jgi:hypothetical protein